MDACKQDTNNMGSPCSASCFIHNTHHRLFFSKMSECFYQIVLTMVAKRKLYHDTHNLIYYFVINITASQLGGLDWGDDTMVDNMTTEMIKAIV